MDDARNRQIVDSIAAPDDPTRLDSKKALLLILDRLDEVARRLDALERTPRAGEGAAGLPPAVNEILNAAPRALAAVTDIVDEQVASAATRGLDVDQAVRNGLAAALHFGQNTSQAQIDALSTLLKSDVLHPQAIDIVGRLGRALVSAAQQPRGSAGLIAALTAMRNEDVMRSTAFLLEFARRFGAALDSEQRSDRAAAGGRGR